MKYLLKGTALAVALCFSSGFAVAADFNPDPGGVYMKDSTFKSKVIVDGKVETKCEGALCGAHSTVGGINAKGGVIMLGSNFESDTHVKGDVLTNCQGLGCSVSTAIGGILAGR